MCGAGVGLWRLARAKAGCQEARSSRTHSLDPPTVVLLNSNNLVYEMDDNSSAPQQPIPPSFADEPAPLLDDPQAPTNEATRPTNRIHDIKLHKGATQFNLTNQKGHVWDLQRHDIGEESVNCNGNMNDQSIQALAAAIGRRTEERLLHAEADPGTSSFSGVGRTIGDRASQKASQ